MIKLAAESFGFILKGKTMSLKIKLFTIFIFVFSFHAFAQIPDSKYFKENWEVYFTFNIQSPIETNTLTKIISIDNVEGNTVYAYANEKEFNEFVKLNYSYKILPHPGDVISPKMGSTIEEIEAWDVYPTYDAYVAMMYQFAANYPSICQIVDAGNTVQGRKILFAKISDNVGIREAEPQFMYSSSMHGDETTGYVLMLRLIDSLLSTYGTNTRVTNIINNVELWINPLANPDGTYWSGNNTVFGARRYNANYVDINRNFPDPADGQHPDGEQWQPETIAMMNIASQNNFVHSANFHGGTEVVNYPWDTWSRLHADDSWWQFISHQFADTAQANSPSTYMNGYNDGITNGYAWYRITGGRQDYMTYFKRGREITLEISDTKLLSASLLPSHWYYLRKSLFNYIENVFYGIRGKITDHFGNPIKALVKVNSHDIDNSEIYSDSLTGAYFRMISPGNYSLTFSASGFVSKTINSVSASNFNATILDVELVPQNPYQLQLTALIEGFFNGTDMIQDSVTVELRNSAEPYSLVEQKKLLLNSSGYGTTNLTSLLEGASYYIIVKHRSSIETWSSAPVSFVNGSITYDFTSAQRKAYGYNAVLKGTKWCIFSGDVNQDGIVDLADLVLIDNDIFTPVSGYISTDLNGNNIIDNDDLLIGHSNAINTAKAVTPIQTQSKELNTLKKIDSE